MHSTISGSFADVSQTREFMTRTRNALALALKM